MKDVTISLTQYLLYFPKRCQGSVNVWEFNFVAISISG